MVDQRELEARRRRRAKRDALVAHAVRLTSRDADGWHRVPLSRHLAKAHKLSEETVLLVLDEAPELVSVGFMVRPRPARRQAAQPARSAQREPTSWPSLSNELVLFLSELQTDAVFVDVAGARGGVVLRLRADFVQQRHSSGIWVACLAPGAMVLEALQRERPQALGPGWSLPLRELDPAAPLPQVVVWQCATATEVAAVVRRALEGQLGVAAHRVRLRRETCTPREMDVRAKGAATVRRLRESKGRKEFAVRTCDRCGQPLSDPASVRLGIGPECLKYYSREVLDAVRGPDAPRPGSKPQAVWLDDIRQCWVLPVP